MEGTDGDERGLMPRAFESVFEEIEKVNAN
jgi:hypothetical protein